MILKIGVSYRFPRVLHRKFSFDTYECYWDEGYSQRYTVDLEMPEVYDTTDIIEAMAKLKKPNNGCDAVRFKFDGMVGDVKVHLERDIDISYHTTIFPDGRQVVWHTTDESWAKSGGNTELLNNALAEAGYHDLIK